MASASRNPGCPEAERPMEREQSPGSACFQTIRPVPSFYCVLSFQKQWCWQLPAHTWVSRIMENSPGSKFGHLPSRHSIWVDLAFFKVWLPPWNRHGSARLLVGHCPRFPLTQSHRPLLPFCSPHGPHLFTTVIQGALNSNFNILFSTKKLYMLIFF